MEPRKLIKLGNSSYAIALPKDWVDKSGLKKGDSVYILPNSNGELILAPGDSRDRTSKVKQIDLSNVEENMIKNELNAAYVQNTDVLEISGIKNKETIKNIMRGMIGFEMIESEATKMTIKDYFNFQEVHTESFLRKIDNSLRSMFEDLTIFFKKPVKEKQIFEMYETDKEINKFYILITKILFRGLDNPSVLNHLKVDSKNLFNQWWIAYHLEHIADEIKKITRLLKNSDIKKKSIDVTCDIYNQIKGSYMNCLNAFYKKEIDLAMGSLKDTGELNLKLSKISRDEEGAIREILVKLSYIVNHIYQINKILIYGAA